MFCNMYKTRFRIPAFYIQAVFSIIKGFFESLYNKNNIRFIAIFLIYGGKRVSSNIATLFLHLFLAKYPSSSIQFFFMSLFTTVSQVKFDLPFKVSNSNWLIIYNFLTSTIKIKIYKINNNYI